MGTNRREFRRNNRAICAGIVPDRFGSPICPDDKQNGDGDVKRQRRSSIRGIRESELSPSDYYLRASVSFETSSPRYAWLNHTVAIGASSSRCRKSKTRSFRCGLLVRRDDKIRTCDPLHPMQVRYRAALRPEILNCWGAKVKKKSLNPPLFALTFFWLFRMLKIGLIIALCLTTSNCIYS